jgi:hypothetical protein
MDISIYIILILLFLIIINYNRSSEKLETTIITNQSKNYITIGALAGLNNRIQVLLSYLYLARLHDKKLRIVWIIDDECPSRFDSLFYPIDDVTIIYEEIDESLYDHKNWNIHNNDYIKANYYSLLHPIITIQSDINNMKQLLSYDNKNYIACHIRRTDAIKHHWYGKHIKQDEEYINFINNCPKNCNIYIATDCKLTQEKFIKIYGDRLKYKPILDTKKLRQTSLRDAVKDMYVCAGAKYFMRSIGSFSDTIEYIRNINNEGYEPEIKQEEQNYIIDGDEIYQPAVDIKHAEHSRFNYKTKECSHWYCLEIMNNILSHNKKYNNVLVLGVALGGQIIHLLNKDSNIKVTGVDISDINFNIVEKYSDKKRLRLINKDANNYIMDTDDIYDVIICDIFIGMNIASFVLTTKFLDKINKMLVKSNSKFLLNTTNDTDKDTVIFLLKKSFNNCKIEIINNPKYVNNLYFITKN